MKKISVIIIHSNKRAEVIECLNISDAIEYMKQRYVDETETKAEESEDKTEKHRFMIMSIHLYPEVLSMLKYLLVYSE